MTIQISIGSTKSENFPHPKTNKNPPLVEAAMVSGVFIDCFPGTYVSQKNRPGAWAPGRLFPR